MQTTTNLTDPGQDTYLRDKKQAARYLGVSLGTLERLMRNGLPFVKVSPSLVRFRPDDLADFIERRIRRFETSDPQEAR